jgi:PAS domain S-box-containing protein
MNAIDLRTLYLNYSLVNIVSLFMMIVLWHQSRKRFEGTHFFVLDFVLQIFCLLLIYMRGQVPDFFSMVVSNTASLTGTFLGLIGLARFTGKKVNITVNVVFIIAFAIFHTWFAVYNQNLSLRNLNFSFFFMVLTVQCAWIMLANTPSELKHLTRWTGIVFVLFSLTNAVRIVAFFYRDNLTNDYLNSGPFESAVILIYQILFTFLTFTLILMFNGRLGKQIANEEEKFSKAFQQAPYAVLITRLSDGKIYEVNEGFLKLTQYHREEVIGKTTGELNLWHNKTDRAKIVVILQEHGKFNESEFLFQKKSGEILVGLVSAELFHIGNEISILTTVYDLTPRKKLENKLVEMNATKDKFFSIIAHDLKSPFSNIVGLSTLLNDEFDTFQTSQIKEFVKIISKSAVQTIQLLDNLLDWSRLQQKGIMFNPVHIDLNKLINDLLEQTKGQAGAKNIILVNLVDDTLNCFADENMLNIIIRNLVSNAVKFTNQGGKIEVNAVKTDDLIVVTVTDNGVGIEPENIEKLFKIESEISTHGTASEKGTGLGLILCREFVEKHGGNIKVESSVGKGSVFSFTIPENLQLKT